MRRGATPLHHIYKPLQASLKLDLVDLLEDNALPVSLAYMYEERLEDIVVLPEDQQRAELLKKVQEAKRL